MHNLILGEWLLNYDLSLLRWALTDKSTGGRACENTLLRYMGSMQNSSFKPRVEGIARNP